TVSIYPTVMNNVFGTKFKLVMGYKGSNEAMLAVERGEVEGHSTSWTALKIAHPDWLRDANVAILVQFALKRHAELPDIPTAVELARNDEERAILIAVMNATEVGTAFFTAPSVLPPPPPPVASPRRGARSTPPWRTPNCSPMPSGSTSACRRSRARSCSGSWPRSASCRRPCWTRSAPPTPCRGRIDCERAGAVARHRA